MNNSLVRMIVSPAARRRARELALDLLSVTGSGPDGRIILRDLDNARPLSAAAAGADAPLPRHRGRAARPMHFHESVRAPLIITVECDVGALLFMRENFNRNAPKLIDGMGAHVTLNDCFVKAIALAARARTGKSVSIGIALGSASAPVIVADACTLTMPLLRQAIRDARAQADETSAHHEGDHADVLVANFSAFGARDAEFPASKSYPIVLSLGAAHAAPVVSNGRVAVATMLHATVCVGEGVLDAATAGAMLAAFRGFVENPAAIFA